MSFPFLLLLKSWIIKGARFVLSKTHTHTELKWPSYCTICVCACMCVNVSVFKDTTDCRQVCPHSWCLILSPLSFHLCYCFPLLTFQTNLVWHSDHRCPADSSPLSKDNLSANLLILFFSWIPILFLFFFFPFLFLLSFFDIYLPELLKQVTILYHASALHRKTYFLQWHSISHQIPFIY